MAILETIQEGIREGFAKLKELTVAGTGKLTTETAATSGLHTATSGLHTASQATHGAIPIATLFSGPGGAILIGGFGALSAVVNQMEYAHHKNNIARFYKDEIAAKNHTLPHYVNGNDLDKLEAGDKKTGLEANYTIKQALNKERWKRNIGIGASFIASIAAFTLLHAFAPEMVLAPTMEAAVGLLARGTVAVLTYTAIKEPLAKFTEKLIGLDRETAHEHVVRIQKDREHGRAISAEQITAVFIAGNKEIRNTIEKQYDAPYEELSILQKAEVVQRLSKALPIDQIQQSLNAGDVTAKELTFIIQGQTSGFMPKALEEMEAKKVRSSGLLGKAADVRQRLSRWLKRDDQSVSEDIDELKRIYSETIASNDQAQSAGQTPADSASFVERVSKTRDPSQSHVERLAQARAAQVVAPSTQTIH